MVCFLMFLYQRSEMRYWFPFCCQGRTGTGIWLWLSLDAGINIQLDKYNVDVTQRSWLLLRLLAPCRRFNHPQAGQLCSSISTTVQLEKGEKNKFNYRWRNVSSFYTESTQGHRNSVITVNPKPLDCVKRSIIVKTSCNGTLFTT